MVEETADHGPRLCLGPQPAVAPSQCGGLDIAGWDWDAVDDVTTSGGATWGTYTLIGTYDGQRFTLTEPAGPPAAEPTPPEGDPFATPCEPPAGGWVVVDEATATDAALEEALAHAAQEPDYGGAWRDQSINPAFGSGAAGAESSLNDPTKLVLNVAFTGDLARHESDLRAGWGGALCVSAAERTEAELKAILDELSEIDGVMSYGIGGAGPGNVQLEVIVDDGLQQRIDAEYGPGTVSVHAALQPVD